MVSKPSKLQFPRFCDSTFLLNEHSPRQSSPLVSPFGGFCSELLRGLELLSVEKGALPLQPSLARWYRPRHKHTPAWKTAAQSDTSKSEARWGFLLSPLSVCHSAFSTERAPLSCFAVWVPGVIQICPGCGGMCWPDASLHLLRGPLLRKQGPFSQDSAASWVRASNLLPAMTRTWTLTLPSAPRDLSSPS